MAKQLHFDAPENWALANVSLFFEGEDLSQDVVPFAASMVVQLRMEAPKTLAASALRAKDLSTAQARIPAMHLIGSGPLKVAGQEVEHLEWMFPDPNVEAVHQLILYLRPKNRMYTVTATHKHDRFEAIRAHVLEVAAGLLKSEGD